MTLNCTVPGAEAGETVALSVAAVFTWTMAGAETVRSTGCARVRFPLSEAALRFVFAVYSAQIT